MKMWFRRSKVPLRVAGMISDFFDYGCWVQNGEWIEVELDGYNV